MCITVIYHGMSPTVVYVVFYLRILPQVVSVSLVPFIYINISLYFLSVGLFYQK